MDQFMLAPWSLILFIPLAPFPEKLGYSVLLVSGLAVFGFVAVRLGAKPIGFAALMASPQVMHCLINGNVDWLALLGFVMPPQIGLFFLAIKPQIGAPLALLWVYEAWREHRFLRTFGPFCAACLMAFLLTGWPLQMNTVQPEYNASLWPASIPLGLALLAVALYRRRAAPARAAGPFLSPHVMFHSWAAPLYALAPDTSLLLAAVAASWGMVVAVTL